ncbi:MAG: hypothetical protein A3E85_03430 [Gammaproteobacteria bacterium RIFCSPHIGHO2_12_FULL_45_12]|nr:MAG: hypothetical protein A3E85_03430 [Gammaproteobacteria bacterium RIFCSPHIGHO2_12_FULL_45_12]
MKQQGYILMLAIIFILVIAVMGNLIAYLFSSRAALSAAQFGGLNAFYTASSGLEIGSRLLTMPALSGSPARMACASITGNSETTHAALGGGTVTLTTLNSSPIFAASSLSGALSASATSLAVSDAAGFAPRGRVLIDREAIDYASLSGNTLQGVTRGVSGTRAATHANNAAVSQYQCSLDVEAGIPSIASPTSERELEQSVQLQDGFLVGFKTGSNFTLSHWNQPTELNWNGLSVSGGSSAANLNAISLLSNADGWAAGDQANNSFIFLHWNGSNWSLTTLSGACNNQNLLGISMISSTQGFAVGANYTPNCGNGNVKRYTVLTWNGSAWSLLSPSTSPSVPADNRNNANLNAVHVIDTVGTGTANIGFAVGDNGSILKYNGSNWVTDSSPTTRNLTGIDTVSTSEAWAVGVNGTIIRWNGSSWSNVSSPTNTKLNAIAMLDTNQDGLADVGWAVGNSSQILFYNGISWSNANDGNQHLFGISIINPNDAWAVGANGTVYHWNGNDWSNVDLGTTQSLTAISLLPQGTQVTSAWRQVFH